MRKVLLFLLFSWGLFAGNLKLFNDSSFRLRAVIRGNDGTYLGEMILVPEHFNNWSDQGLSFGGTSYSGTRAPYTVHWYCLDGTEFGVCRNAHSGQVVYAQSCEGPRSCNPGLTQPSVPYGPQESEELLHEQNELHTEQEAASQ